MDLAQRKYSSHVLEMAFQHADDECLNEMMAEVLDGYWLVEGDECKLIHKFAF